MGASLVLDLNPGGSSTPQSMISIDGILYFTADLGSPGSAQPLPDMGESADDEERTEEYSTKSSVDQIGTGPALLKSDGTAEGTRLLKEFQSINDLIKVGRELYFIADDGTGNRLWKSDGTTRGTQLVKDIYPGADPDFPQDLFEIDGVLFYAAINSNTEGDIPAENGYELWRREGNSIGSPIFKNIIPDKIITEVTIESVIDEITGTTETTTEITTAEVQNDSFPRNFAAINGNLFFVAATPYFMEEEEAQEDFLNLADRDIVGGDELWFSDGTESGTRPIIINNNLYDYYAPIDIKYGGIPSNLFSPDYGFTTNSASSFPRTLTPFSNSLVFVANDGESGFELWTVSDRGENLRQIADLRQGINSSSPEELTAVGNRLYFTADVGNGRELWSITSKLERPELINVGNIDPKNLTAINEKLYFSGNSGSGRELWVAEGNNASLVADINPGIGSSSPKDFVVVNHWVDQNIKPRLYFSAEDGERGVELWSLDLSSNDANPEREADIYSGPYSSDPRLLTNAEQNLYFTASDGENGRELWKLGVTIIGTSGKVGPESIEIKSNENQTQIDQFLSDAPASWRLNGGTDENMFQIQSNGTLSFNEAPIYEEPNDLNRDNIYEVVIRATDTSNGIFTDQKVNVEVLDVISIGNPNGEDDEGGNESDGNSGNQSDIFAEEKQKDVYKFNANKNMELILGGDDGDLFQIKANGWMQFINTPLYDQPADSDQDNLYDITLTAVYPTSGSSNKQDITVEVIYVVDIQGPTGEPGADQSYIQIEERNNDVYEFSSEKAAIWEIDGGEDQRFFKIKSNGELKFKQVPYYEKPLDSDKDNIYEVIIGARNPEKGNLSTQAVDIEITGSDKSDFSLVKNIYPGSIGSNPEDLTKFNDSILFSADNGKKGTELWQSRGTKKKTSLLKDINKGSDSSNPTEFTTHKNQAYFSADNGKKGQELWGSNGKKKGTKLLADINPGAASSFPSDLLWFNQRLFFAADDGLNGRELWNYDPSSKKAKLIDNIQKNSPGDSSNPTGLTAFNGNLYFAATGDIYGRELWKSTGKLNQAYRISDINPGGFNSNPEDLAVLGNNLYFTANTPYGDRAIYKTNGAPNDFTELSISIPEDLTVESINLTFNTPELLKESGGNIFYSASTTEVVRRIVLIKEIERNDEGQIINETVREEMKEENNLLGRELWLTDSTINGMKFVMDINPGQSSSSPNDFSSINGLLYFSADDGVHGRELWVSDGTEEGTSLVADINEGANDSSPRSIAEINGEIYFSAKTNKFGRELWRLDNDTQNATRIVNSGKGKKRLKALDNSNDEFRFELANQFGKAKADQITSFNSDKEDKLALSTNAFQGLSEINLVTVSSKRQLKAQKTQPSNFIYYENKGKLFFDQNGTQKGYGEEGGLFAILKGGPDLTESSFLIV